MDGVQIQDQIHNVIGLEELCSGKCDLLYFFFNNLHPLFCMWKIKFQCITVPLQNMVEGSNGGMTGCSKGIKCNVLKGLFFISLPPIKNLSHHS